MAKKRVALVLSGGVSLGSYIAGALDELLHGLAASGNYEIDVITGASAGATTAAVIAHGLLYRNGETALHDAWVKKVDIVDLMPPHLPENQPLSVLSNDLLRRVARETLTWPNPNEQGVASPLVAPTLTVALTISNIEGLSYTSRLKMHAFGRDELFIQDRFAEQETFKLDLGVLPTDPLWTRIQEVAIASAALPFVFPPVALRRQADNPLHFIQKPAFDGEAEFLYCDGGTFNNLPIDLAWHYARQNDSPGDDRVIIIVDPSHDRIRQLDGRPPEQRPAARSLLQYAFQLLGAVHGESSAMQFDREVVLPSLNEGGAVSRLQGALPGIDRADVEVLDDVALVVPKPDDKRLKGSHLAYALSAFLDETFREYDFRRGAADAQRVAKEVLNITYSAARPDGDRFYRPDDDPAFQPELTDYSVLDMIPSSHDPNHSVKAVFEEALKGRIKGLINRIDPPGPDLVYAWFVDRKIIDELPELW